MKLSACLHGMFAASGIRTMIAMPIVIMVIDMTVEMLRIVIPRAGTDKYAA
jgi:hypothetical protein